MTRFSYCLFFILVIKCVRAVEDVIEVDAVIGHSAKLPCNVTAETGDDKLTILAWYRNGSSTAFYSRDLRNEDTVWDVTSEDNPKGRYQLLASEDDESNTLEIISVRPSDAGEYRCYADFAASPTLKTLFQLRVIEPPQRMWVVHENGTRVATANASSNASQNIGPYYIGDTARFFCVAFGGNPLASLSWWIGQKMEKNTMTPISEHRVRSDVVLGPLQREDHGQVLSCLASNNDVTPPITVDVTVDMYLPPELVSIRDASAESGLWRGNVRAGDVLQLQCRVLGARPTPAVHWRLNDVTLSSIEQNVTVESSQRLLTSDINLVVTKEHDESHVTCCVPAYQRGEAYKCAPALPLTVWYAPVLKIFLDKETENNTLTILKGSDVTMNCTSEANPAIHQMTWFHEDDIKGQEDEELQPVLELRGVAESASGEYVCSASNDEGTSYSDPVRLDVTYPGNCVEEAVAEYGLGENESINLTCKVKANPEPSSYRWVLVNANIDVKKFKKTMPHNTIETDNSTLLFQRPNETEFTSVFCWAVNGVMSVSLPHTPCKFLITNETVPRPPTDCRAVRDSHGEITIHCVEGHDGGLPQKFQFTAQSEESEIELVKIVSPVPVFIFQEPKEEEYKFVIVAINEKGESQLVEILKDEIANAASDDLAKKSFVSNITTLTLALCGGVALVALCACGLVLCARDGARRQPRPEPPLCAYNTDESNCDTCHDSDDSNECNIRRTDSFKRAVNRYPSRNFDVRRTSSFHSARYMNDMPNEGISKCNDTIRHTSTCRVHSLQNINKKREMDALCDHLVMHLPPEPNYQVSKPMNTFYTMPRKMKSKPTKQAADDVSVITTSDGFSLPPPPDEFGTYRAASRIKDMPSKSIPTYTTIVKKTPVKEHLKQSYNNVIISPMNTVGLPTVSGHTIYSYPDENHQVSTNPFDDEDDSEPPTNCTKH